MNNFYIYKKNHVNFMLIVIFLAFFLRAVDSFERLLQTWRHEGVYLFHEYFLSFDNVDSWLKFADFGDAYLAGYLDA